MKVKGIVSLVKYFHKKNLKVWYNDGTVKSPLLHSDHLHKDIITHAYLISRSYPLLHTMVIITLTGVYSVIGLVYVSEMSPSHIRGRLALASYLNTGGGILCGSIAVGLFSLDTEHAYTLGWRLDIMCVV